MKKTKIVCTLGPASTDENVMREMLLAGMNVARMNFSHGSHEMHKETLEKFRRVRDELKLPAAVMLDTKGPEIRLGTFEGGKAILKTGERFTLTGKPVVGNSEIASVTYADMAKQLKPGTAVLLDDGRIRLEVEKTTDTDLICRGSEDEIEIIIIRFPLNFVPLLLGTAVIYGLEAQATFKRIRTDNRNGCGNIDVLETQATVEGTVSDNPYA